MELVSRTDEQGAYVELSFAPNAALVSTVRDFVAAFYVRIVGDGAVTDRLAVATHELLENAVRYSIDGWSQLRVAVQVAADATTVQIDTRNRAAPGDIAAARRALDAIAAAADPGAHYVGLMRRTARQAEGSGLGLGRVCAEADMRLQYTVDGATVSIRAEARFETGSTP
jgi:hypothetical protein